ncbi:hypothetical protein D6C90_01880 [Aureobasidium pullulans]|uniref:Uncharacterized protein n=1 Tax=Aureobasidium pullulans TaxID=5580 RepID=A0A4S9VIG5_AURPU|nr:hypothetical protein D6C99_01514 [Aureobasidium pullulans]THZ51288.1 hypothetical protein D6C90_01880 [Aureobasidium pullulans]
MSSYNKSQFVTPNSSYPPSPRSILEEYFMEIEDLQDIDAVSISSSVSTKSRKVISTLFSGISYSKNKLLQLTTPRNPIDFGFQFPSLEGVFPS